MWNIGATSKIIILSNYNSKLKSRDAFLGSKAVGSIGTCGQGLLKIGIVEKLMQ